MRQWIAYIFICIFSFQILPLKEIGKILFKGQLTEEVHETETDADTTPEVKLKKEGEPNKLRSNVFTFTARILYYTKKVLIALHNSANVPRQFVPDILTPPPNFC